ncbi:MAG: uroporphyrinogen decarboxylase family protein [Desulfitobacteriaceae bacterium]
MNHKERVLSSLSYNGYDRLPIKHGATPEINKQLFQYFKVNDYENLLNAVGDDIRKIEPLYVGPELQRHPDGSWDGLFGERYADITFGHGSYPEAVYLPFKDIEDVKELERLRFPSADWFDYSTIVEQCKKYSDFAIVFGSAGHMDLINGVARCRGVEQVLIDIALEDPVYLELINRRFEFYYEMHKRVLEAAHGCIDIIYIGEDLGQQNGLLISPEKFEKLFAPKLKRFIDLGHEYRCKVMMHSCGSVVKLIPRFIELGLDILDVVQTDATNMDIISLHKNFYGKICFSGTISVQSTLPFGTKDDVIGEVELRKELFKKGGIIIGPSHAIQVGTPIENIIEMYRCIGGLGRS